MSQYPNPYSGPPLPPQGGYPMGYASPQLPVDPLAPARRASLMMFILGTLGLLCGVCMGVVAVMPIEQMMAQQGTSLPPLPPGMSYSMLPKLFGAIAILAVIASVAQLILGVYVRKASAGASVCGIVLAALFVLYFVANTIFAAIGGQGMAAMAVSLGLSAVSIFQLVLLIQALRASSIVKQMQAAYQAQYWQYMQQQQAYQTPGYNQNAYNAPPAAPAQPGPSQSGWQWAAPPPPPPPAAPSQAPPNDGGTHGPR